MFPVGFLFPFDTKVLRNESIFNIIIIIIIIIINNISFFNLLIFWGWLFVTYGFDLVSIPRY